MYLKTLKVAGFKSFADRTRLEFRPGVAVVVGPNGAGKSNLVDAIHWVMGTQAPKSLRTQRMEDVIFAGTATRPAVGRCEVTVVFDNGGREVALDLDEVSITRRLYRDGSSDYEVNGVGCRLLDIQDLLSDSGVGRHQHIIVNQGQVDSVLSAGPDEHRAIIEEAAGILKHRLRKERAIRRLERTEEDVIRLMDVLSEITRQMRPLKRQAEAAERHQRVADQVKLLTLFLGGEDLRRFDRILSEAGATESDLRNRLEEDHGVVNELAAEIKVLESQQADLNEALERDGGAGADLETTLERLRRISQVAHERHRTRRARREGADERRRDLTEELTTLISDLGEAAVQESRGIGLAGQSEHKFRLVEDEERSLTDQENLSAEGVLAVVEGDLRSLTAADQRDRRELEAVSQRVAVLNDHQASEDEEAIRIDLEIRQLDAQVSNAQRVYESTAATRRRLQDQWESIESEHTERRLESAAAAARLEAVTAAAESLADPDARKLMESIAGSRGSLLPLLDVPLEWVAAVDSALGPWSGAVAFVDQESIEAAVSRLKASGHGGIPLTGPGQQSTITARGIASRTGLPALVDLLGPKANLELAGALMGDVVVAEGWKTGWEVVRRHPGIRVVTPEGDLIATIGIRTAQPDGAPGAMAERAGAEVDRAERELARVASRSTSLKREFEQSRQAERRALEGLEALEVRLGGAAENLGRVRRTRSELEAETTRMEDRRHALVNAIGDRHIQIDRLTSAMTALQGEEAERQRLLAEWAERRLALAAAREAARAAWQEATSALSVATERRSLLEARRQVVEEEVGVDQTNTVSAETLEFLTVIETHARRAIEAVRSRLDLIRARQENSRQAARAVGDHLSRARAEQTLRQAHIDEARSGIADLAIDQTEARVRREAVVEALVREIDASENEALQRVTTELGDGEDPHAVLSSRKAELRRMGPINPLAAEEYRQLFERHQFMTSQLEDLESSRNELRKVMRALDGEIESKFSAAFVEIATAYQEHFGVLFPGGKGRMSLTEPENPLTSGVEIEAQPLGKKISKLSLLSGGERSLAALAFLFAVFKARPSPFYILDEVEAALDDSNLRRFLRLVEAFRGQSQMILITHQQQTMEAADVLYGVTMEPGGSSQVIVRDLASTAVEV